jgi:hypothetical protein
MIPIAIFSTDREAAPGPARAALGTSVALEQLSRLSGAASQRSDAIFRSMDFTGSKGAGAGRAEPFLATDAGNAALQKALSAGIDWMKSLGSKP